MNKIQSFLSFGSGQLKSFKEKTWPPLQQAPAKFSAIFVFFLCLIGGAFITTRFLDSNIKELQITTVTENSVPKPALPKIPRKQIEIPLNCTSFTETKTCPTNYPTTFNPENPDRPSTCPEYFRWIHEDLKPWKDTGITREMIRAGDRTVHFKLVILNGKAYIESFLKGWQTRDTFTFWGILQLLRKYPGKLPDLELMFNCNDRVEDVFFDKDPPPLFRYCGEDASLDIVFPDWSFWGWPEINIKPWGSLLEEIREANKKINWTDREPHAYWKGNPYVALTRDDMMKCNVSETQDWGALLYVQDWIKESQEGYKNSNIASQCVNRYKIFIEGVAWSVSEKYILACNSPTLLVTPHYRNFFSRSLVPLQHYWPIKEDDKCRSIKYAVDWGNSHEKEVQDIGNAASKYMTEDTNMDNVYDYMFHLLKEYAKLLKFKPELSLNAVELCSEKMACEANGLEKSYMLESLVKGPADTSPCVLPPPYDRSTISSIRKKNYKSIKEVETLQKKNWKN